MKRIFFIAACLASANGLLAQEPADALRYGWITSNGTARQQAIGGAMASLGGDISATFVNPAGLGFFKTGDFVLTPAYNFLNNKSSYFGRTEKDKSKQLSFGTSGIIWGTGEINTRTSKSSGSAFAIAVNRTANFNNNILYRGINTQSSYSQKFLEQLRNDNVTDANVAVSNYPFGTSLAMNTFWIDTANGYMSGNRNFVSLAQPLLATGGLIQEQIVNSSGGITELALAGAGNIKDKFYFGATLGIPFLNYTRESSFSEADATTDVNNRFDFATINENLSTKGTGLNLKLGIIYKPVEYVRLGFAFHTPTFYRLTDKYNATVITDTEGFQGRLNQSSSLFTGGNDAEISYWHFTPYRVMISGSYVLREIEDVRKQKGFITADIEYSGYKNTGFYSANENPSDEEADYFKGLNQVIKRQYKGNFNFRVGGELKFNVIMARLGFAYYTNPYKDDELKARKMLVSGGIGYRHKGFFIDLTYVHSFNKDVDFAYRLADKSNTFATVKNGRGNLVASVGVKF